MKKKIDIAKAKSWQGIASDIREAIACGQLKAGDILQGEKKLAEKYNSGLYSIRSAINSLKETGVLYSVPKQGVFVNAMEKNNASPPISFSEKNKTELYENNNVIHYVTRSSLPLQRSIYETMAGGYSQNSISSKLEIVYHSGDASQPHPKGDIYEYGSQSRFCFCGTRFVDLKKYFKYIIHAPEQMMNSYSVPLFRSIPLVIYNRDLLKKMGFDIPAFKNYSEQMNFLDELTCQIALQSDYYMPGTTQNMVLKCGNIRRELYRDIVDFKLGISEAKKKYSGIFQKITHYWKKYHISYPGRTAQIENEFIAGKSPLFFGLSSHFIKLKCANLPFELGASILYSHDNTIDNDLGLLSIDMDTANLVEAARAVDFMQTEKFQEQFAAIGYVPILERAKNLMPFDNIDKMALNFAYPLIFQSAEEYYITINIINVELWNVVLFEKSIEDTIDSIFSFARSYLQMKLDQAAIDIQTQKSDVYM